MLFDSTFQINTHAQAHTQTHSQGRKFDARYGTSGSILCTGNIVDLDRNGKDSVNGTGED